jgi:hypothetical protein
MKSQGHSTGSLVGKGNFCTKFSNTGTILTEIANTYSTEASTKKGTGTPLRSGTGYMVAAVRGSGRITVLQLGGFRVFWRVRDVGGA